MPAQESAVRMPLGPSQSPSQGNDFMKLIHDHPAAFIESRLERLASGRRRRRLQRRETSPAPGNSPSGNTLKKAA
jgi:hypothetical protein